MGLSSLWGSFSLHNVKLIRVWHALIVWHEVFPPKLMIHCGGEPGLTANFPGKAIYIYIYIFFYNKVFNTKCFLYIENDTVLVNRSLFHNLGYKSNWWLSTSLPPSRSSISKCLGGWSLRITGHCQQCLSHMSKAKLLKQNFTSNPRKAVFIFKKKVFHLEVIDQ